MPSALVLLLGDTASVAVREPLVVVRADGAQRPIRVTPTEGNCYLLGPSFNGTGCL